MLSSSMTTNMKFISTIIIVCAIWHTSSTQELLEETQINAPSSTETKISSTITTTSTIMPNKLSSTISSLLTVPDLKTQRVFNSALPRKVTTGEEVVVDPLNSDKRFVPSSSSSTKFVVKNLSKSLHTNNTPLVPPLLKKSHQILRTDEDPVESVPSALTVPLFMITKSNEKSSNDRNLIVAPTPSTAGLLDLPQLQASVQKISSGKVSSSANSPEATNLSAPLKEETAQLSLPFAISVTTPPLIRTQAEITTRTSTSIAQRTTPTPARQPSLYLLPPHATTQSSDQRPVSLTPVAVSPLTPTTSLVPLMTTIGIPTTMPPDSKISDKFNKIRNFPKYRFKTKRRRRTTTTEKPEVAYTVSSSLPPSTPFSPVPKAAYTSKPQVSSALPVIPSDGALESIPGMPLSGGSLFNHLKKPSVAHQY